MSLLHCIAAAALSKPIVSAIVLMAAVVGAARAEMQETSQGAASTASAEEDQPPASMPADDGVESPVWDRLTGDWFSLRTRLEDIGITFEASYTGDFMFNARGGANTHDSDTWLGLFDLSLSLDTQAMGLWNGGTFFVDFQDIRGESITERHVGDLFYVNNDDAPARAQLAEFWYEQLFLDGMIRSKLGKQDVLSDFAYSDMGGEFINGAFGWIANAPTPTYPDPALGAALFVEPVDWLALGGGVYDADGSGTRGGFDTAFHGTNDSFTIAEIMFKPVLTLGNQRLPGVYRVGGWYHTGVWDVYFNDLDGRLPGRTQRGNTGVYTVIDQTLWCEHPEDELDEQGLGAFFQYGWAPSNINEITSLYGGGLRYIGLIPTRDADITGLGMSHASLSGEVQALERRYSETALELFHKVQITDFVSLKPDAQYIVNPGGDGRDAIVVGIRLEVSF